MRARRLSPEERQHLRRQRSETRLIIALCQERKFEYVVKHKKKPKIAFGSTLDRDVLATRGPAMDSYMRRQMIEYREAPGPIDYDVSKKIGFNYPSKNGCAALASKSPRLPVFHEQIGPPIGAHDIDKWHPTDRNGWTFGHSLKRKPPKWMTPGPSTYSHHIPYDNYHLEMAFGKQRIIWPAVAVSCGPYNTAMCMNCHQQPHGDYFHHFGNNQDMCRNCMRAQMRTIKDCKLNVGERFRMMRDIRQFVPARYCDFFHDHSGTTAKTEITTRKVMRQKIHVENYLYRFNDKPI